MSHLPKGWTTYRLGNIAERITKGATPTSYGFKYQNSGIRFIKVENINNGRINHSSRMRFISEKAHNNQKRSILEDGDILFSIAGTIGTTCLVAANDLPANTNQALAVIRGTESAFDPHFLRYQLQWNAITEQISDKARGGGMNNISLEDVKNISLHIAPKNEQHRIAAKLEDLLGKVDRCKERLDRVPAILQRFRRTIISAACSGLLTKDWRDQNSNIEPVSALLSRSREERNAKYQSLCRRAEAHGLRHPQTLKTSDNEIDASELEELPETWLRERLLNIAHIVGGVTKGRRLRAKSTIMVPYLRVANVQDGYLDLTEIKEIEALPEDLEKYRLKDADILFTEGGDRDKLGRGTVWQNQVKNCIHQNHIFRARLYSSTISPDYISLATKSDYSRRYFFDNASQTVNLASINLTTLGDLPIAVPPVAEQREIVRRVETLFKIADQIEARYQKAKAVVDKLTQSILAKAFRGELVPQDPNDEPASELLKRIREERARRLAK